MNEEQAAEVSIIEKLRSVPNEHRSCVAIQWAEDGTETGHRFIPVGYMMHEAADALESADKSRAEKDRRIAELESQLDIERHRLAACGVAALGYFEGCAEEYKSASLTDVLALRAQLSECQKDAERYQFIRTAWMRKDVQPWDYQAQLDRVVDAAIKESK